MSVQPIWFLHCVRRSFAVLRLRIETQNHTEFKHFHAVCVLLVTFQGEVKIRAKLLN